MGGFSSSPRRSRIIDEFAQIRAEHRAKIAQTEEESRERYAKVLERSAEKDKEIAAWQAERAAAKAEKVAEEDDEKPDNPWAQPTRLPDSAARIGQFDDEYTPAAPEPATAAPPARPAPVPSPPAVTAEPEPRRAPKALPDDDDDFSSGSFLRS